MRPAHQRSGGAGIGTGLTDDPVGGTLGPRARHQQLARPEAGLKHGIVIAGEAGCAGLIDETLLFRRYRDGPRGRRPGTDPECSPGHEHRARYPHDKST